MNILPKVYRFVFYVKDKNSGPSTSWVVARNQPNAIKRFKQLDEETKTFKVKVFTVSKESWLANVLILLLPRYTYKGGGDWSKWSSL